MAAEPSRYSKNQEVRKKNLEGNQHGSGGEAGPDTRKGNDRKPDPTLESLTHKAEHLPLPPGLWVLFGPISRQKHTAYYM